MKKRIVILCAMLLLLSVFSLVLTGCGRKEDVTSIAFVERPSSTYFIGDTLEFSLKVTLKDGGSETVSYPADDRITVSGFSTATAGTYTATVSYDAYSLEFTYSVYSDTAEFAGGTGSAQEPYLIASATQFQNMLKKTNAKYYYKLIADIDFSGVTIKQPVNDTEYAETSDKYFSAVIDGNGYSLLNVDNVTTADGNVSKMNEIFGIVGDFTLKNITVNFASTGHYSATGLVTSGIPGSEVLFENVKTTGFIDASNAANTSIGVFVMQSFRRGGDSVVFKNCVNETNILNSTMNAYVAGFTTTQSETGTLRFDNCTNKGTIEGANTAVAGFATFVKVPNGLSFVGCKNEGTIIKTVANEFGAGQIVAFNSVDNVEKVSLDGTTSAGTLDESLSIISASFADGKLSFTFPNDSNRAKVAYYRIVHVGGIYYVGTTPDWSKPGSGLLLYSEKLSKDATSYTIRDLVFAKDIDVSGMTGRGEYGNPNIVLGADGKFYYDDMTLAQGCSDPSKVIVFAYDENNKPIGVSAPVALS